MFSSQSGSPKSYAHQPPITYGFNRAWAQPKWFVDPINGNNSNVGDTESNPIKTVEEYHRRVGTVHEFNHQIRMKIMSSLPRTDLLDLSGLKYTGNKYSYYFKEDAFILEGKTSPIASGIATIRQFNQALNIPYGLSCNSIGNLSQYVKIGRMVRRTTGNLDSLWLLKDEDGFIARASQPYYIPSPTYHGGTQGTIATGDPFEILELPEVPCASMPTNIFPNMLIVQHLHFSSSADLTADTSTREFQPQPGIFFRECAFDYIVGGSSGPYTNFINCQVGPYLYNPFGSFLYFVAGGMIGTLMGIEGRIGIENYTILQGCKTYVSGASFEGLGAGVSCHTRGFGIYDSPDSAIVIPHGGIWYIEGSIYGSGNSGHPVEIQRGGKLFLDLRAGVPTLTGGTGLSDILLGQRDSGPAVDPTTWAYTANRAYSFPNLALPVAAGGFGGNIFDPLNPSTAIVIGD